MRNGFENITNKMRAEQDRFVDDVMKKITERYNKRRL